MKESLAQTLRANLGDNPLVLLENSDGTTRNYFLSDPDLDLAARELAKRIAPACPQCGVSMTFVTASDYEGWACMSTPLCVCRIPLHNAKRTRPEA
jgi:hypothetical protein